MIEIKKLSLSEKKRLRANFGEHIETLNVPPLLDIQLKSYDNFISERDPLLITYFAATTLFVPWVLIYSLTDVALFDERAFLMFVTIISLNLAINYVY